MQEEGHSIFPLLSNSSQSGHSVQHSESQDDYEMSLVGQYLDLNQQLTIYNKLPIAQTQTFDTPLSPSTNDKSMTKRASVFHNFQKHLINTLKRHVKIKKSCSSQGSKLRLAYQLWQYFVNSSKATKKFLFSILGDNLYLSSEIKNDPNERGEDLRELMSRFGQQQLELAQEYLWGVIVKQSQTLVKGKLLKGRRIQRLQEFQAYFQQFTRQLVDGVVTRRMPKLKRNQLFRDAHPHCSEE